MDAGSDALYRDKEISTEVKLRFTVYPSKQLAGCVGSQPEGVVNRTP